MAASHHLAEPLILLVPGHAPGGASDWMNGWARQSAGAQLLDLGLWDKPHRNTWVNKLNLAIQRAERPVIVVSHGVACLAVIWWAEYERPGFGDPVSGALLVAPPDVERPEADPHVAAFGACPRQPLPFASFVVVDRGAPGPEQATATQLARDWQSRIALDELEPHALNHGWQAGRYLLRLLLRRDRRGLQPAPQAPGTPPMPLGLCPEAAAYSTLPSRSR